MVYRLNLMQWQVDSQISFSIGALYRDGKLRSFIVAAYFTKLFNPTLIVMLEVVKCYLVADIEVTLSRFKYSIRVVWINEFDIQEIFKEFKRLNHPSSRNVSGLGAGASDCR